MLDKTLKFFAPVLVAASLAALGCASANPVMEPDENVASTTEAAAAADEQQGRRGMHGHPLLAAALKEIDLSAEQRKTIEAAIDNLHGGQRDQMKAVHKTLADQVRAGKIDETALKAQMPDVDKAHAERRAAVVKAVETLHSTLTPAQRTQLVTLVKDRMQKHAMHGKKHGDEKKDGEHRAHRGKGGPMMFLLHGIELRDDQRQAIKAAMPPKPEMDAAAKAEKFEAHRARMDAALEAFKGDKFDANAVLPERDGKHPMAERFVKMLQAVVPVLDAEQRAELAKRLEEGPRMGHHRGKGKHGRHGHGPGHHQGATE